MPQKSGYGKPKQNAVVRYFAGSMEGALRPNPKRKRGGIVRTDEELQIVKGDNASAEDSQIAEASEEVTQTWMGRLAFVEFLLHGAMWAYTIVLLLELTRTNNFAQRTFAIWEWVIFSCAAAFFLMEGWTAYHNWEVQAERKKGESAVLWPPLKYGLVWTSLMLAGWTYHAVWRWGFYKTDNTNDCTINATPNCFDPNIQREWDSMQWTALLLIGFTTFRYLDEVGQMILDKFEAAFWPTCFDL